MTKHKRQATKFLQDFWLLLPAFVLVVILLFAVSALIFLALRLPLFIRDYETFRQWMDIKSFSPGDVRVYP